MYSSPDAVSWTGQTLPTIPQAIVFGGGKYVVMGNQSPGVIFSTNATDWNVAVWAPAGLNYVAFGNGVFVAGGGSTLISSFDGVTWSYVPDVGLINGLCYGRGMFLAASGTNIYRSVDSATWQPVASLTNSIYGLYAGLGNFVATTSYSLFTSTNGSDWAPSSTPFSGNYVSDCTFSSSTCFVATPGSSYPFFESNVLVPATNQPVNLAIRLHAGVEIVGNVGSHYRVEYSDDVAHTNWTSAAVLYLLQNPTTWVDPQAATGNRFYRSTQLD
jgi:hypothetical protein